jgi:hypothetical protein
MLRRKKGKGSTMEYIRARGGMIAKTLISVFETKDERAKYDESQTTGSHHI